MEDSADVEEDAVDSISEVTPSIYILIGIAMYIMQCCKALAMRYHS